MKEGGGGRSIRHFDGSSPCITSSECPSDSTCPGGGAQCAGNMTSNTFVHERFYTTFSQGSLE